MNDPTHLHNWRVLAHVKLDPLPADWRERLAVRLGQRPRRIGTWAELALYGARLCLDAAQETALPALAQLRVAADALVDIHGQHAWQSLTRAEAVRELLDAYAGIDASALDAACTRPWSLVKQPSFSTEAAPGRTTSAAVASEESGSLVTPIVNAPRARARSTYSSTSGVWPDCESPSTSEPRRSTFAP